MDSFPEIGLIVVCSNRVQCSMWTIAKLSLVDGDAKPWSVSKLGNSSTHGFVGVVTTTSRGRPSHSVDWGKRREVFKRPYLRTGALNRTDEFAWRTNLDRRCCFWPHQRPSCHHSEAVPAVVEIADKFTSAKVRVPSPPAHAYI